MGKDVYEKDQLYSKKGQREYPSKATEAAFLLGGIGTGNISLNSRGKFQDWEIFNKPAKEQKLPFSFFAIRAKIAGKETVTKILESKHLPPYSSSHGYAPGEVEGLPHLDYSIMKGEYPFVTIKFKDKNLPVLLSLEAFTPFIPLNADDSGIPGAILRYRIQNPTNEIIDIALAGSIANAVGFEGYNIFKNIKVAGNGKNEYREDNNLKGLFFTSHDLNEKHINFGSLCLATTNNNLSVKPYWPETGWYDGLQNFWDDFKEDGRLEKEYLGKGIGNELRDRIIKIGSIAISERLQPGKAAVFEFILTWYFPNRKHGWGVNMFGENNCCNVTEAHYQRNYYSRLFSDAWDVSKYLLRNMERLERLSRSFQAALFNSTLPDYVIDAIAANITVIRSPTCFRTEDGKFFGFEGCHDSNGCCEGNCTHVWNYAQTLAFLFPELEREMRKIEFNYETDSQGAMSYRAMNVFNKKPYNLPPAADGQLGAIIRLYREWKISGDDEFLKEVWINAKRALDFSFKYWDSDRDFVLDGQQHNTYDIEFYGSDPLINSIFLAALKAASEIADYLGDEEYSFKYKEAFKKGSKQVDKLLWNGEYYEQKINDVNKYKYQYGKGCLSDQLFGQLLAHVVGIGYILPEDHVKKAIKSVFKYNFRESFEEHQNAQRTYALNDEKGLLLCSWPNGGRPELSFIYSDEVWTGIEYQVAAHLIYEGYIDEGLTIIKAVRDRYDGYKRNPWDEVECGHHYVRSMSSWAVLLALSGFKYDMGKKTISFKPAINKENFSTFWSTGKAWGIYNQKKNRDTGFFTYNVEVLYGNPEEVRLTENLPDNP